MEQRTSTRAPEKGTVYSQQQPWNVIDSLKNNLSWYQARINENIGNRRSFTILTAVWAMFAMYMSGKQRKLESILDFALPDTVFAYRPVRVFETVAVLGRSGREIYSDFLVMDFAFGLVTCLWLSSWLNNVSQKAWMIGLPFAALLVDWAENASLLSSIQAYPSRRVWTETLASLLTPLKYSLGFASLGLAVVGSFVNFGQYFSETVKGTETARMVEKYTREGVERVREVGHDVQEYVEEHAPSLHLSGLTSPRGTESTGTRPEKAGVEQQGKQQGKQQEKSTTTTTTTGAGSKSIAIA